MSSCLLEKSFRGKWLEQIHVLYKAFGKDLKWLTRDAEAKQCSTSLSSISSYTHKQGAALPVKSQSRQALFEMNIDLLGWIIQWETIFEIVGLDNIKSKVMAIKEN